ncbi:MAG: NHLP bacteriocin system secretion protein [Cyanobacteriota bacterium]|nr:NHLP bacteriocin system secretion protein [Cyanobacteriota bacterium]
MAGSAPRPAPEPAALPGSERRVLMALVAAWGLTAGWFLLWPVPTEVIGRGVVIVPGGATVIDARAPGQIQRLPVRVGERVRRGQTLVTLSLPALEQQLRRQQRDLAERIRINADLDRRDRMRLASAQQLRDTALAKLQQDRRRFDALRRLYDQKVADFRHLARREVVAPLAQEVVASEDRATELDVSVAALEIREREALDRWQTVKLEIETEALRRRYAIDEARRAVRVTQAQWAYDGSLEADRDGRILDLQVVRGQTVKAGERLGTLGSLRGEPLRAVAYFAPADARRLRPGLAMEVVPDWNERGRFGGIRGRVLRVSLLPATREDVNTTMGNPQLAEALVRSGPVLRTEIALLPAAPGRPSLDGYRWTLSRGSSVFPIREGLTLRAHGYVEWRTPASYVLPTLRDLTGSFRSLRQQERQEDGPLRQRGSLP